MAWGDMWGTRPWGYHEKFVEAFMEGREYGSNAKDRYTCVKRGDRIDDFFMEYRYKGRAIARYTPAALMPEVVAAKLTGARVDPGIDYYPELEFRAYYEDKGEARHLKALGIDAQWQYGGKPFLVFGADADDLFRTIADAKALPKWVDAPPVPKRGPLPGRERFVNLTLPLFPEFA